MKTIIRPITVPYKVTFNGNEEILMTNSKGDKELITPFGEWLCCRAVISNGEYVAIFNNKYITCISIRRKNYLDFLFHSCIKIGYKYDYCFEDFVNDKCEFQI